MTSHHSSSRLQIEQQQKLVERQRLKSKEKGQILLVNKIKNKLRQSKEKLEVGRSVSKYQLMQIMADLDYLGQ
jgi:hypothetical protein